MFIDLPYDTDEVSMTSWSREVDKFENADQKHFADLHADEDDTTIEPDDNNFLEESDE